MRKKVLIYRSRLLPFSETFIYDHWRSLRTYDAYFAGIRVIDGIPLPQERVLVQFDAKPDPLALAKFLHAPQNSSLYEKIASLRPDVIHAHFAVDAVEAVPIAKKLKVPLIVTLHGYDVHSSDASHVMSGSPYRWNYIFRRNQLTREASLFLPVSDYVKQAALKRNFPSSKTRTHVLGIDPSLFSTNGGARRGVLFVGRIVEKKGLEYLIRAIAKFPSAYAPHPVTIIGEGELRAKMERLAKRINVNAIFLGKQPRERVKEEMARARVLCMPSIRASSGDNEGLPIVALEAQASGCPVVAFDQGPIPAAISNGVTGLLARDRDVGDLASCIQRLLNDELLSREMSIAGPPFIARNFDIFNQTVSLEEIYTEILDRSSC